MRLEEAIKQESFRDEYQKVGVNIIYTASWLDLKFTKVFKSYGITGPQFNVLGILRGSHPKPATVNDIISRMLDKNSNASRIVEKLRVKKFLKRVVCPEDRRAVNVMITKEGLALLEVMDKEEKKFAVGLDILSEEEAKMLNHLLDKIRG
ncbi:MAG: winged helix-turn-helix transcriptional regulator [Bacteroidetes bacterium]|nr:winged helix-turn-helix transcriptional regulator [Bacteroidota bacterium]